ncbi:MAG: hypothetical protein FD167_1408 [bacterium]|nr:MAG: hypothetical protein FD167_1408 [bacterium]
MEVGTFSLRPRNETSPRKRRKMSFKRFSIARVSFNSFRSEDSESLIACLIVVSLDCNPLALCNAPLTALSRLLAFFWNSTCATRSF